MCRDDHVQIGHNDSEHEMCPLCRAHAVNAMALAVLRDMVADWPVATSMLCERARKAIVEIEQEQSEAGK
jgi:hypothetical protein